VKGIYAPLQKLFALKGEVLDPIFSIKKTFGSPDEKIFTPTDERGFFPYTPHPTPYTLHPLFCRMPSLRIAT
jgi:hypothetical protein